MRLSVTPPMLLLLYVGSMFPFAVAHAVRQNASVTLDFQGTAVYVFGSQVRIFRLSLLLALIQIQGTFNASLEETSPVTINGITEDSNQPLIAFTNLPNKSHTINMTALAAPMQTDRLHLDHALVTVGDGDLS
jgi:hypothetical protein